MLLESLENPARVDTAIQNMIAAPTRQQLVEQEAMEAAAKKLAEERAKNTATIELKLAEVAEGFGADQRTNLMKNIQFAFNKNVPREQREFALRAIEAGFQKQGLNFALKVTDDGGIEMVATQGPGQETVAFEKPIGASKTEIADINRLREANKNALDTVQTIETLIDERPELFGLGGGITKFVGEAKGISEDLAGQVVSQLGLAESFKSITDGILDLIDSQDLDEETRRALTEKILPPSQINFGNVDVLETTLRFGLLMSLTEGRRPLKVQIDEVFDLVQLRGIKSREGIKGRLSQLRARLQQHDRSLQRRLEKGVEGRATSPSLSVAPEAPQGQAAPSGEDERLKQAIDNILGTQ
jgi:hypothetical protein